MYIGFKLSHLQPILIQFATAVLERIYGLAVVLSLYKFHESQTPIFHGTLKVSRNGLLVG